MHNPEGIAVDGAGNIYIADKKNNAIRKVRPPESPNATGVMTTIAGLGPDAAGCIAEDTKASEAPLSAPQEVAVDAAGNLYIADAGCRKIRKIGKDGIMHTLVGSGAGRTGTPAYVAYNGPTQEAGEINLGNPVGVKADAAGNLYISDPAFGAIWFYDTAAKKVSLLAGGPVAGGKGICPERSNDFGDGCPGLQAKLNIPFRVALDTKGNLYIPEQGDLAMPMHPYAIRVLQAKQQGKGTGKSNR